MQSATGRPGNYKLENCQENRRLYNICTENNFSLSRTEGKKKKQLERLKEQLLKLEVQETDKEENKTIALGTSKLNYLDPRISVAW